MRILLCTDLDRTLLPNGVQPESEQARVRFSRLVGRPEVSLVYVTGRHQQLIEQAIDEYQLPRPDYVIANVGTTIYRVEDSQWQADSGWSAQLDKCWRGLRSSDIQQHLVHYDQLKLQEPEKQTDFKLSYYVSPDHFSPELLESIEQYLKQQQIITSITWSIDETTRTGLLDILPACASKKQAIEYLAQQCGLQAATVFAGDSGNDLSVLISQIPSILVANATDELKQQVLEETAILNSQDKIYIAKGNFMGMNGHYSAGILEGIAHYYPISRDWMEG